MGHFLIEGDQVSSCSLLVQVCSFEVSQMTVCHRKGVQQVLWRQWCANAFCKGEDMRLSMTPPEVEYSISACWNSWWRHKGLCSVLHQEDLCFQGFRTTLQTCDADGSGNVQTEASTTVFSNVFTSMFSCLDLKWSWNLFRDLLWFTTFTCNCFESF